MKKTNNTNKSSIIHILLKTILKKGKLHTAEKILTPKIKNNTKTSIKKIIEHLIASSFLPLQLIKPKQGLKYQLLKTSPYKTISLSLSFLCKTLKKNKKKHSFTTGLQQTLETSLTTPNNILHKKKKKTLKELSTLSEDSFHTSNKIKQPIHQINYRKALLKSINQTPHITQKKKTTQNIKYNTMYGKTIKLTPKTLNLLKTK